MICMLALVPGLVCTLTDADLRERVHVTTPGIDRHVMVASATTAPWVNANGWRFRRAPGGKFYYDVPQGKAALAAAESLAFGADAILKIAAADHTALEK